MTNLLLAIVLIVIATRESQLMVLNYFFRKTPELLITGLFMGIVLYLALHGIWGIARLAGFTLIPPLFVMYTLQMLGLTNVHVLNTRPFLTGNPGQWLTGGFDLFFVLIPITGLFNYLPFIRGPRSVVKIGLVSLSAVLPLFF